MNSEVYKFTWDQELGWEDWRSMEWTTRAKSEREAWLLFYDRYEVLDHYVEWLEEQTCDEINKKELWKTVDLEELEKHALWMVSNEWLRTDISGAEIKKV